VPDIAVRRPKCGGHCEWTPPPTHTPVTSFPRLPKQYRKQRLVYLITVARFTNRAVLQKVHFYCHYFTPNSQHCPATPRRLLHKTTCTLSLFALSLDAGMTVGTPGPCFADRCSDFSMKTPFGQNTLNDVTNAAFRMSCSLVTVAK
jgi:hypothetical protein